MINLDVDDLKLYIGDDYVINDNITIFQPTIRMIAEFGEREFFSVVHTLVAIPSDMKAQLWDMGLDWMEVEDFELFMMLVQTLTPDRTSILFGNLDFSKLRPYTNNQNGDIVLADKETGVIIDKMIYLRIVDYLRKAFNITPKIEKAANKAGKEADKLEREEREAAEKAREDKKSKEEN